MCYTKEMTLFDHYYDGLIDWTINNDDEVISKASANQILAGTKFDRRVHVLEITCQKKNLMNRKKTKKSTMAQG